MFWDPGSFYSSPLPYSVYCFSSAWFSSYVEGWLWTSYPYPGQERGDVATPATPPTRKAILYQKPLLPPQARCYLHLIGQQFVTFSRCQEVWGSKFIFLASLWKETRRKGVGNCCGSANQQYLPQSLPFPSSSPRRASFPGSSHACALSTIS